MPAHARAAAQQQLAAAAAAQPVYAHAAPRKLHPAGPPPPGPPVDVYANPAPKPHWPPQPAPQMQANPFAQVVSQARGSFGVDLGQGYAP